MIDVSSKAAVQRVRGPAEAFSILRKMLRAVFLAAVDMKSTQLQTIELKKGEKLVEYSKRSLDLVNELHCVAHSLSGTEQKSALFGGLPEAFVVTTGTVMDSGCEYH